MPRGRVRSTLPSPHRPVKCTRSCHGRVAVDSPLRLPGAYNPAGMTSLPPDAAGRDDPEDADRRQARPDHRRDAPLPASRPAAGPTPPPNPLPGRRRPPPARPPNRPAGQVRASNAQVELTLDLRFTPPDKVIPRLFGALERVGDDVTLLVLLRDTPEYAGVVASAYQALRAQGYASDSSRYPARRAAPARAAPARPARSPPGQRRTSATPPDTSDGPAPPSARRASPTPRPRRLPCSSPEAARGPAGEPGRRAAGRQSPRGGATRLRPPLPGPAVAPPAGPQSAGPRRARPWRCLAGAPTRPAPGPAGPRAPAPGAPGPRRRAPAPGGALTGSRSTASRAGTAAGSPRLPRATQALRCSPQRFARSTAESAVAGPEVGVRAGSAAGAGGGTPLRRRRPAGRRRSPAAGAG